MSKEIKHESHCKYCKELAEDCTCSRGSRLLSEQEICQLSTNPNCEHCTVKPKGKPTNIPCSQFDDKVLVIKAQDAKTLSALIAWGTEYCMNNKHSSGYWTHTGGEMVHEQKRCCDDCWAELKESVK